MFSKKLVFPSPHNPSIAPPTGPKVVKCRVPRCADRAADRLLALSWRSPYARVGPAWGLHGAVWGLSGAVLGLSWPCLGLSGAVLGLSGPA